MRGRARTRWALAIGLATGCTDGGAGETSADASTSAGGTSQAEPTTGAGETAGPATETGAETGDTALAGPCPAADRVGAFEVVAEELYSAFSGAVADGVVPITVLELVGEGGGCQLLRRNNPFCATPCQPGETCDFDMTCIPYPTNHDVGTVTVSGLVQPVEAAPGMTFMYSDTTLTHPAFAPGAAIELTAAGGDYAGFTLRGEGVAAIEPAADTLTMKKGQPLAVAWTPGAGAGQVRVELVIDQHGNTPVRVVCVSEDTGSLAVPAAIVDELIGYGISGFPSAQYHRETVDSRAIEPGCVQFSVRTHRETLLAVEGHTPCNKPADCPDGQICNIMIQTCE